MNTKEKAKKVGRFALSAAERILIELFEFAEDVSFTQHHGALAMSMGARQGRAMLAEEERFRELKTKRRTLLRLRSQKLIVARLQGDRMVDELTKDGRIAALALAIRLCEVRLPEGQCCLISFDVPESARRARQQLLRLLKRCGFRFDHLSVWKTDRDVGRLFKELVTLLKIEKWMHVFHATRY